MHSLIVLCETNVLSLISQRLDNYYQIEIKRYSATDFSRCRIRPELNAALDAYALAATRWIGHGPPLCTPTLGHQLLWCLAGILADVAHDWLCQREHLRLRAVIQRMRAARASKTGPQAM